MHKCSFIRDPVWRILINSKFIYNRVRPVFIRTTDFSIPEPHTSIAGFNRRINNMDFHAVSRWHLSSSLLRLWIFYSRNTVRGGGGVGWRPYFRALQNIFARFSFRKILLDSRQYFLFFFINWKTSVIFIDHILLGYLDYNPT